MITPIFKWLTLSFNDYKYIKLFSGDIWNYLDISNSIRDI